MHHTGGVLKENESNLQNRLVQQVAVGAMAIMCFLKNFQKSWLIFWTNTP